MGSEPPPRAGTSAFFALVWTAIFYALVLAGVVGLAWLAYQGITGGAAMERKWVGLCVVSIGLVLFACLPRRSRFVAPGPALVAAEQPALAALLETVARETGQAVPATHWSPEAKLALETDGGFLGLGGRRILTLGFPIATGLDAEALKAALAGEFARSYPTDGVWTSRVGRMRDAIRRSADPEDPTSPPPLFVRLLRAPFAGFAQFFLEVSAGVGRRQRALAEFHAARIAGAEAVERARVERPKLEIAWIEYLEAAVEPVLLAKRRPPVAAGWRIYLAAPEVRVALARREERSLRRAAGTPDVAARVVASPSGLLAGVELGGLDALELELLDAVAGPKSIRTHAPIEWDRLVPELLEPQWRDALTRYAAGLRGLVAEAIPSRPEDLTELGRKLNPKDAKDPVGAQRRATLVLSAALAVSLRRAGFGLDSRPGAPLRAQRGSDVVDVDDVIRDVASGRLTPIAWAERCRAFGIAGLDLGTEAQAYLG
jgi:hypothetical protein